MQIGRQVGSEGGRAEKIPVARRAGANWQGLLTGMRPARLPLRREFIGRLAVGSVADDRAEEPDQVAAQDHADFLVAESAAAELARDVDQLVVAVELLRNAQVAARRQAMGAAEVVAQVEVVAAERDALHADRLG